MSASKIGCAGKSGTFLFLCTEYVPQPDKTRKQFMLYRENHFMIYGRKCKKAIDRDDKIEDILFAVPKWRNW